MRQAASRLAVYREQRTNAQLEQHSRKLSYEEGKPRMMLDKTRKINGDG